MNKIRLDLNQLFSMSNADIETLKGKYVSVALKGGDIIDGHITNFEAAANPPHLITGFIFGEKSISFPSIDFIEFLA